MKTHNHRFHDGSIRLQSWDYRNKGEYFITINTKNRKHFFGEIKNGEMHLGEIGKFAEKFWIEIPDHFAHVKLGKFVIMPDHVHGILIVVGDNGDWGIT